MPRPYVAVTSFAESRPRATQKSAKCQEEKQKLGIVVLLLGPMIELSCFLTLKMSTKHAKGFKWVEVSHKIYSYCFKISGSMILNAFETYWRQSSQKLLLMLQHFSKHPKMSISTNTMRLNITSSSKNNLGIVFKNMQLVHMQNGWEEGQAKVHNMRTRGRGFTSTHV